MYYKYMIKKCKSLPNNISKLSAFLFTYSFDNFNSLLLQGQEKHLSFGEYSKKQSCNKENKKKVIKYFYSKL